MMLNEDLMRDQVNAGGFKIPNDTLPENPWTEREYLNAVEWLSEAKRTKHINQHRTSYGWKHTASNRLMEKHNNGDDYYISNGAFIAAAIDLGFIVKRCAHAPRNAWLNISKTAGKLASPKVQVVFRCGGFLT